jgi:hypothetical protein
LLATPGNADRSHTMGPGVASNTLPERIRSEKEIPCHRVCRLEQCRGRRSWQKSLTCMANPPPKPLQNPRSRRPAKTASPGVLFLVGILFFLFAAVLFATVLVVSRSFSESAPRIRDCAPSGNSRQTCYSSWVSAGAGDSEYSCAGWNAI